MTKAVDELWWCGPDIRSAAEEVSADWPSVATPDELTSDLSLALLDLGQTEEVEQLPSYRRRRLLKQMAREMISRQVAEYEQQTGNSLYSVGEIRHRLETGGLTAGRTTITAWGPDLDEGCRFLAKLNPGYADIVHVRFVSGGSPQPSLVSRAVSCLTDCMNRINQNRPENRKAS